MSERFLPISRVEVGAEAERLVLEVLRSGQLAQGPMVERLEHEFAATCGVAHAVAVSNGTVSLIAALTALGIGPGDEVITSPFTFVATVNAILAVGATARLVDIALTDYCLDPDAVAAAVGPRTAAIMPVHLYGQVADMHPILAIARRNGLAVVEDAAQAHGAEYCGARAGSFGVGSFSFYATKNITTAEGGIVTTKDAALADRIRILRNQGMRARYRFEMVGHNWRMTDLAAAVGLPQLAGLDAANGARARNARALVDRLAGSEVIAPAELPGRRHVWHQFTVRVPPALRAEAMARLDAAAVGCGIYYPATVDNYECYAHHPSVVATDHPLSDAAAESVLSVPVHPGVTEADCDRIAGALTGQM